MIYAVPCWVRIIPHHCMARDQPWKVFPELQLYQTNKFENTFEIIKNFDKTTQSYIN